MQMSDIAYFSRVVTFDHLGFGFSDKPFDGFTFSIFDHAEYAMLLLEKLGKQKENRLLMESHNYFKT